MNRNGKGHGPSSLSEAIEKLETAGHGKSAEVKEFLDREFSEIREKLQDLKPYLEDVKDRAENEVKKAKHEVENRVKDNPWMALGLVGFIAFFIGWLVGWNKRD